MQCPHAFKVQTGTFIPLIRCESHFRRLRYGFCLLRHTKTWLARDIISYSGTMFLRVLYYIVNFWQIAFAALFAITHAALPCKRVVNKRL